MLNGLNQGVFSIMMHYFLIVGTFPGYEFLISKCKYSRKCLPCTTFSFWVFKTQRFLSSLKQKKIIANQTWCINDCPKRKHLTDQLISNSTTIANLNAKFSVKVNFLLYCDNIIVILSLSYNIIKAASLTHWSISSLSC